MQKNVPDVFQAGGLQPTPFAGGTGPLSNPNAFIQHVFPMVGPHVQALVDAAVQTVGTQAVRNVPYTVGERAPEVKGNNYTAFLAQMDKRPVVVFRRNEGDEHYVVPMERFINPARWFAPFGVLGVPAQQQHQQSQPQQQQEQQQHQQQQQQSMNLFEYMSKLPPNERMLYTLLIYILLSDAISNVFRRGRTGGQSPPIAWQTPWMPGPPRGSQWMVWG